MGALRALGLVVAATLALGGCALGGCALGGCGGARPMLHRDDGYEAIQRDEAVIEEERAATLGVEAEACAGACRAVAAICEASERICAVAQDLQEADTFARCSRARQSCTDAREHVARTCVCEAASTPAAGS